MKTIKLILTLVIIIVLNSCCNDDELIYVSNETTLVEKTFRFEYEDNLIEIDDTWYHNSNLDFNDWMYYHDFGCKVADQRLYIYVNPYEYELIEAEILSDVEWNFNTSPEGDYYFYGPSLLNYLANNAPIKFKLTVKEIN